MTQINKIIVFALIGSLCITMAGAQQFNYKAPLNPVSTTGFYQLAVTPEISSYVKTDFFDLRITDKKGNWVPHILKTPLPVFSQSMLREFPVISNRLTDSGKTELVLENKGMGVYVNHTDTLAINEIVLFIKNNAVSRYAAVSGSNNQKQWYIINENILLHRNYEAAGSYFINTVKFNKADYKYFKLIINNEKSDPLNVIKAGTYFNLTFQSANAGTRNPPAVISQKDSSNGKSYIQVQQATAYHIDEIMVSAAGSKFFKRNAAVYLPENETTTAPGHTPELSFVLSSGSSNTFLLKKIKAQKFWLVIDNNDNPPLKIKAVTTLQVTTNAVAWLEAGKKYWLLANNNQATMPQYDIETFKDSIPTNISFVGIGTFTKNEATAALKNKNTTNKWWVWPCILGAIVVLGFLSWKLLADIKKSEV